MGEVFIEGTEARAVSRLRGRRWGRRGRQGRQEGLGMVAWELGVESEALGGVRNQPTPASG